MLRSTLYILAALVAVVFGFDQADQPAIVAASGPEVSVQLTQAETDCIVGGQAGCLGDAKTAVEDCVEANLVVGDPKSGLVVLDCYAYGAWTGLVCAVNWFFGLFF
jgi:hypothetical protein